MDTLGLFGTFAEIPDWETSMATSGGRSIKEPAFPHPCWWTAMRPDTTWTVNRARTARWIADFAELEQPHRIVTVGKHVLEGIATATVTGAVTDQDGKQHQVALSSIVVPGLGRHLLSVAAASTIGAVTIFNSVQPHLEM